ncbi:MAG: transglutaminase domain-containing protein [Chloroflexota bacterium]
MALLTFACQPVSDGIKRDEGTTSRAISIIGQREYTVRQRLVLQNAGPGQPEKQNLWVALIRDLPPYQEVKSLSISPDRYTLVTDEYGNQYAEFDFSSHPEGSSKTVEIKARVVVSELAYDLSDCKGNFPDEFVQPELHVESANPQIVRLSQSLVARNATACQKVRAFYDYVGNELTYTSNEQSWGAQAALGPMGADCTEYTSLLMALSRAQGIPARYFEGLRYLESGSEAEARIEHAWPDAYMPGVGWVAVDPTLGRSSLNRETYFAHYTPDHIIVTMGRNPSTLRGSSYWTHLYWPGDATKISVESAEWQIELVGQG